MPNWRKLFCCVGVRSAPDKPQVGGMSGNSRKSPGKSPAASMASLHSTVQQSNSAWDLYDNTGVVADATAGTDSGAADGASLSGESNSSQSQPKVNGLLLSNFLRQAKSVRFDDQDVLRQGLQQNQQHQQQQPARCPATPDSFYDDLKNRDYSVVPPEALTGGAAASTNYDELPRMSEILNVCGQQTQKQLLGVPGGGRQDTDDYALPPQIPPHQQQQRPTDSGVFGDYDYSLGGAPDAVASDAPDYQNVAVVVAAAAAAAAAAASADAPPTRPHQSQQQQQPTQQQQHRLTQEFLDDLLLSPSGSSSIDQPDADKRSIVSNTESIDSEDIGYRPECQLRMGRSDGTQHLRQLEADFTDRCARLYKFIHSRWKAEASLALNMDSLRPTLLDLNELLEQLIVFYYGILNNARLETCPDRALSKKIWKHLRVFERNADEFHDAVGGLEKLGWNPKQVAAACSDHATDYLGFCVSSARDLQIQQRALSTAVHANSPLLFPDILTAPDTQKKFQEQQHSQPQPPYEKVIPIETEERRRQTQPAVRSPSQQQQQSDGSYMRMSLLTDSSGLSQGDQELLAVFRDRLRGGSEVYTAMSQDLLATLEARESSGAVIGAQCRNLVTRAYKLIQMASMLQESLHSVQLRAALDQLINQFGHLLKAVLRTSKTIIETAPAEWQQQLANQLSRYIVDTLAVLRELTQLVAPRVGI